ncbi:hypothetical protein HS961_09145 [Comamonas piscis]|uniref:Uncharacterized protein n=1 Tax=Comamonas piscis TaxID=1562974 RepID=A0A7G5EG67_9BURK|nr:hypothetical protein [Comamonas piscis]QMV72992.1 hypothetical protein HS961_09145 [Comamonas piscis]WSO35775.1 hypothetical protein VUJ63_09170 [Comamonas piscis]
MPRTVSLGAILGLNNRLPPARMEVALPNRTTAAWLQVAKNIDLTASGFIRRREGSAVVDAADCHSIWADKSDAYMVRNGDLVHINVRTLAQTVVQASLGSSPVQYARLPDGMVYWTNRYQIGRLAGAQARRILTPIPNPVPQVQAVAGSLPPGRYQVCFTALGPDGESPATEPQAIHLPNGGGVGISGLTPSTLVYATGPDGEIFNEIAPGDYLSLGNTGAACSGLMLKAMPPGAALAHYKGSLLVGSDRLYVDPANQVLIEGLFTSGVLVSGESGVFTSDSPLRPFKPRGRLPFSSVEGGNFQDQGYIASHSDATGYVVDNQFTGFAPDFDVAANAGGGSTLTMAAIVTGAVYRTRNGAVFQPDFTAYSCRAIPEALSGSILDSVRVMPGQYVLVNGVRTGFRGASFVTLEMLDGLGAGHYWPNFLGIKRDNTGWNGDLLGLPYTMIAMHQLLVLGPGRYLLVMRCMRSVRRPTLSNNLSMPVAVAQFTKDAGQTWEPVASLAAAEDEFATVMAFPQQVGDGAGVGASDRYAKYFNDASFYTSFSAAAPISATRSLALMMVTYNDYANSGGEVVPGQPMIGKLRTRIKVVRIDTAGAGSITEAQTVFHGRQLEGAASLGDVLPTGDGMLFWLRDVEADVGGKNQHRPRQLQVCSQK